MGVTVTTYEKDHIPMVKAFNERLRRKGESHQFPESHISDWLPPRNDSRLRQEYFVAANEAYVRGGYILKHQEFRLHGSMKLIYNMQSPISEGVVDPAYALVGAMIARDVMRKAPLNYTLGMGGFSEPITRFLKGMRWKLVSVPFYFRVINCNAFLRRNAFLRKSPAMRILLDLGAFSGAGAVSVHAAQFLVGQMRACAPGRTTEIEVGDADVDAVWERVKDRYPLIALRDSKTVDILYPVSAKRFHRKKVFVNGTCIGWVVTLCTQMVTHKQFGSLRVGSIIDCLSHPDDACTVVKAAAAELEDLGADIIVANHSHRVWGSAFVMNGFLRGPSNFIFGASTELAQQMGTLESVSREIFFMRGDGDGPINL